MIDRNAMLTSYLLIMATLTLLVWSESTWGAADPARGATIFQSCTACHSTTRGVHMTGPSLANIWQRKPGTVPDFSRYSDGMLRTHLVWNEDTLDRWLSNPEALIPGTSMTFSGLRDSQARQDVVAYLKTVSEGKAPARPRAAA